MGGYPLGDVLGIGFRADGGYSYGTVGGEESEE